MKRQPGNVLVAAFAAAGPGAVLDVIRVQVLLFLIDRVVADRIGGPFFQFRPYLYGPFDRAVHDVIRQMVADGQARIDTSLPYERYLVTEAGRRRGMAVLGSLPVPVADYFGRAARWVRLMPYRRMLAAVHRAYPEMAVGGGSRPAESQRRSWRRSPFIRGMARAFDLTGTMFRSPDRDIGLESDRDAIQDAWRSVGQDIEDAMVGFGESERLW